MTRDYYERTTCRMCEGSGLTRVMRLTPTPPGNNFLRREDLGGAEARYPLELNFCEHCHHVQLAHVVDPKILYQNNYSYVSATSAHFVRHLEAYAAEMIARCGLAPKSLVADIGSNDGTCLQFFQRGGMEVVGVDPAVNIAERATERGIRTVPAFFSYDLAKELRDEFGPASFITSHNACAHIDHLDDVLNGVNHWLADDGVFVLEVGYFVDVYSKLQFDTIYHEHLDYHTVEPFESLFARKGMEMLSVQRIEPQGGSIRVLAQKAGGPRVRDDSVDALIALERDLRFDDADTFRAYGERIGQLGEQLRGMLAELKRDGHSIAGFGAPTKATTLLGHFGIGGESLDFIIDENPLKQGLYSPLSHLPVLPAEELYARRPDFLLILAWNFAEPIMSTHRKYAEEGGQFILPMPVPRMVKPT